MIFFFFFGKAIPKNMSLSNKKNSYFKKKIISVRRLTPQTKQVVNNQRSLRSA